MKNAHISNAQIIRKILFSVLQLHISFVACASLFLVTFDAQNTSLFGIDLQSSFATNLSFAPAMPWRNGGITFFSYALVHMNFQHLLFNLTLWIFFAFKIQKDFQGNLLVKQFFFLLFYALASALIAISFLFPLSPNVAIGDRMLGLSALVLFQLGFLFIARPTFLNAGFIGAMLAGYWLSANESALSLWGHVAGICIGACFAFIFRLYPASEVFGLRHSYLRLAKHRAKSLRAHK